jgi:outer membrane immunogenic protein
MNRLVALMASAAIGFGVSDAASAADLPVKALLAPAPVWSWTGFYVGAHVGAGWGTTETTLNSVAFPGAPAVPFNLPISQNSRSGFLGGGQVGFNYQTGWIVVGAQADIAGLDVKGTTPCVIVLSCTAKSHWLATVSGRVGGVVADRTLLYVKGGAAWLNTTHTAAVSGLGGGGFGGPGQSITADSTTVGWLLGIGVEYMFARNWTGFLEYNYMDFDTKNVAFTGGLFGPGAVANVGITNKLSVAKAGVNYKF